MLIENNKVSLLFSFLGPAVIDFCCAVSLPNYVNVSCNVLCYGSNTL